MTLRDFEQRLISSGLMTAEQAEEARTSLLESLGEAAENATPQTWGKHLVQTKRATLFQVSAVASGRPARVVLGDYELQEKIASGGMGDVYKAHDRLTGAVAVVKVLPPASASDSELVKRFHREIRLLSEIKHPNIVGACDAGESEGSHFLAMEFVDGADLGRIIKLRGPMPAEDAVECIRQAAVGLAFAHERGVIHRDVKPSNLMLDHQGMVKILDMGLARILHNDDGLTSTGSVLGSVDYMAPEQGIDSKLADHRADIYALGCTLFYLMTGRIVFDAKNISQKLLAHQDATPPSLAATCPGVSGKFEKLYQQMLAKAPKDRPARVADLLASLKKVQKDLPASDLTRYMRGSSANLKDVSSKVMAPTAPGIVAIKRPEVPSPSSGGSLAPVPFSSIRRRLMTTQAPFPQPPIPRVPMWRLLLSGVATAGIVTVLMASLFWNNG
jgi:serine/threonine protein kinase